jgi:hypothetical protein
MRKIKLITGAIAVAGIASVLTWQYTRNASLRDENDQLRQSLSGLKQIMEVSVPAAPDDTLTEAQRAELLKLRGEATQLREQTNQLAVMVEANQKLRISINEARAPRQTAVPQKKKPEDALPQDIHPKELWAFRGYGTPESTVESTCWAILNGDKETFLKAFGPDMLPEMEKAMEGRDMFADMKKSMLDFRVLDRQQISPDEMVLTISTARQDENGNKMNGSQEDTVFRRINGDWKVTKEKPSAEN